MPARKYRNSERLHFAQFRHKLLCATMHKFHIVFGGHDDYELMGSYLLWALIRTTKVC
jgi:hypothetical protein